MKTLGCTSVLKSQFQTLFGTAGGENNFLLKGSTMLFHAFRVVYTGKELDSHAKHRQSFKTIFWTYNRVFLCQKSHFRVRTSYGEFFSIVVLDDVNHGGTPYMGISPGRMCRARIDQSESSQSTRFNRQRCTRLAREECL